MATTRPLPTKSCPPVSWTPKATKVVEGGEMKEFTLQLAKDSHFRDEDIIGTAVTSGPDKTQTLSFKDKNNKTIELKYSLSDIRNKPDAPVDSTGCGPSKTFTYYVREKTDDNADHELNDTSTPTFTNTYSTSLPLSGMSGVTLTYLAGAAVLCAAAVWMHIRRKTNVKGGERRE